MSDYTKKQLEELIKLSLMTASATALNLKVAIRFVGIRAGLGNGSIKDEDLSEAQKATLDHLSGQFKVLTDVICPLYKMGRELVPNDEDFWEICEEKWNHFEKQLELQKMGIDFPKDVAKS